jgi:hypothetical protein
LVKLYIKIIELDWRPNNINNLEQLFNNSIGGENLENLGIYNYG